MSHVVRTAKFADLVERFAHRSVAGLPAVVLLGAASFAGCGEPDITDAPDAPSTVTTPTSSGGKGDVFGDDDRVEAHAFDQESPVRAASRSAAAMIRSSRVAVAGGEAVLLGSFETLSEKDGLCADYPFSNQPTIANCSGFLVAPDLIVTAGHCVAKGGGTTSTNCDDYSWVFGLEYEDEAAAQAGEKPSFGPDDVYKCAEVLAWQNYDCSSDYAVVRLDRPVVGREPLELAPARPPIEQGVFALGFPSGIPLKISPGAVTEFSSFTTTDAFETTVDGFGGNSGGAVVGADGRVHGILVCGNGYQEYVWDDENSCTVPFVCEDDTRCRGIANYGIDNVAPYVDCLISGEPADSCAPLLPTYEACDALNPNCPDDRVCGYSPRSKDFRCLAPSEYRSATSEDCFTAQCAAGTVCLQHDDSTNAAPHFTCEQVCESSSDCDRGECSEYPNWPYGGNRFCE